MTDAPEVIATAHELIRVATGHPIRATTVDGQDVTLRLPTADEFRRIATEARESLVTFGLPVPEPLTDQQITAAVRPLEIPR